jgi:hypothetical protein
VPLAGPIKRAAQQLIEPGGFVGKLRPQGVTTSRQAVTGDEDLLSVPVRAQAIAVLVNDDDTPGELIKGAKRGVSLELQLGHAATHSKSALQMREQRATTLDIVAIESGPFPRAHDLEQNSDRICPREHRAKPVMKTLRL